MGKSFNIKKCLFVFSLSIYMIMSCKKKEDSSVLIVPTPLPKTTMNSGFKYPDSVLYLGSNTDQILPVNADAGTYQSFPEGLQIDELTGAIDLSKSETGLKYNVTFTSLGSGKAESTTVIVSGINYMDKIYNLSAGDSVVFPVYNADHALNLPGNANTFDESKGCKKGGISINGINGRINLAESVRNQGIDTGATEEVNMDYRISDRSQQSLNNLRLKIYFYRNTKEIPKYLTDLLVERKGTILSAGTSSFVGQNSFPKNFGNPTISTKLKARPRPPCIIVVSTL